MITPHERRLNPGEIVREGDVMVYNKGQSRVVVRRCKYDPGCCVGHMVELNEYYVRKEEDCQNARLLCR